MSEAKNTQVGVLLITGLLAILGTVAGGVIKGDWDNVLADKKFQADLIMKVLDAQEHEVSYLVSEFIFERRIDM